MPAGDITPYLKKRRAGKLMRSRRSGGRGQRPGFITAGKLYAYRESARSVRMRRRCSRSSSTCMPSSTSGWDLMLSSRPRSMMRPYAHHRVPITNLQARQLGRERRQSLLNLTSNPLFNVDVFYLDGRPDVPHPRQLFHP